MRSGRFVAATGVYPPTVKVFECDQLALKFERYLEADCVQFCFLEETYAKLAFLGADRSLQLHAKYGRHHTVRLPKVGRDMILLPHRAELFVAASGSEVYRLNLDQGRFAEPLATREESGNNCLHACPAHRLVGVGGDDDIDLAVAKTIGQLVDRIAKRGR